MLVTLIFIISGLFFLLLYMWFEGRKNIVIYTELTYTSLPKQFSGMKLFFISDIHHRMIDKTILEKIKNQVDVVIIGGDLTEKGVPYDRVKRNVKLLTEIAPTYFVWGNNDYEVDHFKFKNILLHEGVTILTNEAFTLTRGKEKFHLIGVDDLGHRLDNLELALKDCQGGFRVLISHNPDIKKKLRKSYNINLILSGHTHGGQIRLFGFGITAKAGLNKLKEDLYMLVSNGYGTTRLHLRLGAPPQTHIITLKSN